MKLKKKPIDINNIGDAMEAKSFDLVSNNINHLLQSFFLFKKRKGEVVAGSVTFFAILSFGPILMLMISSLDLFFDDQIAGKEHVLNSLKENIPQIAPWILTSFSKIIDAQLSQKGNINLLNIFFLAYSVMGVVGSLMFGINTIAQKKSRGGFYVEDLRSMGLATLCAGFMAALIYLGHPPSVKSLLPNLNSKVLQTLIDLQVLPITFSLSFFTLLYQSIIPLKVSPKESLRGAITFVSCFMIGKSFYWVYHLYSKDALAQSYGNFYTMVLAVFWIYYLTCSFFYGASVASFKAQKQLEENHLKVMPPLPQQESKKSA